MYSGRLFAYVEFRRCCDPFEVAFEHQSLARSAPACSATIDGLPDGAVRACAWPRPDRGAGHGPTGMFQGPEHRGAAREPIARRVPLPAGDPDDLDAMTTTRETLLRRVRDSGDSAAWEQFFARALAPQPATRPAAARQFIAEFGQSLG